MTIVSGAEIVVYFLFISEQVRNYYDHSETLADAHKSLRGHEVPMIMRLAIVVKVIGC
jgi:hypothetical protein